MWARSVGVEILNELQTVKGAMMGFAGAESSSHVNPSVAMWGAVAAGIETIETMEKLSKAVASSLSSIARKAVERALIQ